MISLSTTFQREQCKAVPTVNTKGSQCLKFNFNVPPSVHKTLKTVREGGALRCQEHYFMKCLQFCYTVLYLLWLIPCQGEGLIDSLLVDQFNLQSSIRVDG